MEADGTADRDFGTMEMAFVYGVVTLALDESDAPDDSQGDSGRWERVACLLSQAGYDVVMATGRWKGEPHEWIEVGAPGRAPEVIVDISSPGLPHDTVLLKRSRKADCYSSKTDDG